jgi:hypothetical protein
MADAATPGDSKDDGKKGEQETLVPDLDKQERKLQDCLCLLLFIVALLGWLLLAIMVTNDGCPDDCNDPMKLVYGFDSEGCMCGKDCTSKGGPDNTGKKTALYSRSTRYGPAHVFGILPAGVCIQQIICGFSRRVPMPR